MNRRNFLTLLAAGVAGAALDPDFLKWEPGARRYFDLHVPRVAWLQRGDIFTVEGWFVINPGDLTRVMVPNEAGLYVPVLRQFVVTADVHHGDASVPFCPHMEGFPRAVVPTRLVQPYLVGDTAGSVIVRG